MSTHPLPAPYSPNELPSPSPSSPFKAKARLPINSATPDPEAFVLTRAKNVLTPGESTPIDKADLIAGACFSLNRIIDLSTRQRIDPNIAVMRVKGLTDFILTLTEPPHAL